MIERYEGPEPFPPRCTISGRSARSCDTALGVVKAPLPLKPGGTYKEVVEEDFE